MMTELVAGRDVDGVAALRGALDRLLAGDPTAAADPALGDLRAFAALARFPARHRCALLPWEALRRAMQEIGDRS
jgi:nitrogen fixation NifU-like protein